MTTKLRVRYDGSTLVPLEPVDFPTGSELEVFVDEGRPPKAASPSAQRLLDAIWAFPPLDPEAADEFERALKDAKTPMRESGIFDDLTESGEAMG